MVGLHSKGRDSKDFFGLAGGTPRQLRVSDKVIRMRASAWDLALSRCSEIMTIIAMTNITFAMPPVSRGRINTMQFQKSSLDYC